MKFKKVLTSVLTVVLIMTTGIIYGNKDIPINQTAFAETDEYNETYMWLYKDVLDMFYNYISTGWENYGGDEKFYGVDMSNSSKTSYLWTCNYIWNNDEIMSLSESGFQLYDVNNDGTPELLLGKKLGSKYCVIELYTIKDEKIIHLASSGERDWFSITKDNRVRESGTSSAFIHNEDFWNIENFKLVPIESYMSNYEMDKDYPYFYSNEPVMEEWNGHKYYIFENYKHIDEDTYKKLAYDDSNELDLDYIFFSEYDPDAVPPTTVATTEATTEKITTNVSATDKATNVVQTTVSKPEELSFDLNGDGKTNAADIVILHNFLLKKINTLPISADLNNDGKTDIFDAVMLRRIVLNLRKSGSKVIQVSIGNEYTAALMEDGSLYTWGRNDYGQLGNGTLNDSLVPLKMMENVKFVDLSLNAAITGDNSLYVWGGMGEDNKINTIPVKILDNVKSVSSDRYHTAALTYDGSLYVWGTYVSSWGMGVFEESDTPIKIMDNVKSYSFGDGYRAAIDNNDVLYTWGKNVGQLGFENESNDTSIIKEPAKLMDNVQSISVKRTDSVAVTNDGNLYVWGVALSQIPIKMLNNVRLAETNGFRHIAITNDGILYECNGNSENNAEKLMEDVESFCFTYSGIAAITTDGSLYVLGNNEFGELGNGAIGKCDMPTKIMDNVKFVTSSKQVYWDYEKAQHSAAITEDGSLYIWGSNNSGQLGNGTTKDSIIPVKVEFPLTN